MTETKLHDESSAQKTRQLAAVMFTDMTGYTALMQEDEKKAKILSNRQRTTLEKFIPFYNGKILQYYGDGTLSIFGSATEAVKCAAEIQKELQKAYTSTCRFTFLRAYLPTCPGFYCTWTMHLSMLDSVITIKRLII